MVGLKALRVVQKENAALAGVEVGVQLIQDGTNTPDLLLPVLLLGSKLCHFMPGYARRMNSRKYHKTPAMPGISILSRGFKI